jgi:hypothetical protein
LSVESIDAPSNNRQGRQISRNVDSKFGSIGAGSFDYGASFNQFEAEVIEGIINQFKFTILTQPKIRAGIEQDLNPRPDARADDIAGGQVVPGGKRLLRCLAGAPDLYSANHGVNAARFSGNAKPFSIRRLSAGREANNEHRRETESESQQWILHGGTSFRR